MLSFLTENWVLIVVAFISGAMLVWPAVQRGRHGGAVSPAEAVQLINREKGVVVDVAEPAEYAAGHVAGARNVPLGQIDDTKDLPSNKALPLIVVCPTGARAARAVGLLRKRGYENARPLAGGLAAWREASLPVEKAA